MRICYIDKKRFKNFIGFYEIVLWCCQNCLNYELQLRKKKIWNDLKSQLVYLFSSEFKKYQLMLSEFTAFKIIVTLVSFVYQKTTQHQINERNWNFFVKNSLCTVFVHSEDGNIDFEIYRRHSFFLQWFFQLHCIEPFD